MNEFDQIAKKLWFGDRATIKLLDGMTDRDRMHIEQRLLSLYGVNVNLFGTIEEMGAALEGARNPL